MARGREPQSLRYSSAALKRKHCVTAVSNYEEANNANAFRTFFDDFLIFEGSLEEFLAAKRLILIQREEALTISQNLLWYSQHLGN